VGCALSISLTRRNLHEDGAFVPTPTSTPSLRDARLFFPAQASPGTLPTDTTKPGSTAPRWTGAMWSYPVVQNGLVYVVDIDLGLYVLQYTGPHASEVAHAQFVEGNSAPARYTATAPRIVRSAAQWPTIEARASHGAAHLMSPYLARDRNAMRTSGFICL
jgi:hypothetical protein